MSGEDDLAALKARRDASRAVLMERVADARHLANPATLISRARADLEHGTRSATFQALDIANDNRGIVVATASAVVLWLMRQQVARQIAHQLGQRLGDGAIDVGKALVDRAPGWVETWSGKIGRIWPWGKR